MKAMRYHLRAWRPGAWGSLLLAAAAAASAGCSSNSPTPTGPSGTYKGTLVGTGASGVLTLSFPAAAASRPSAPTRFAFVRAAEAASAPITVTGTLTLTGGGVVQLTGVYNESGSPQLSLAGGGYGVFGNYTASNGTFSGTTTFGDGQTGFWTVSANAATVRVFCGTYTSTQGNGDGTWNLVLDSNNHLSGAATDAGLLSGTYNSSGNAISVTYTGGTAAGTLDPSTGAGSGTYDAPNVGEGDAGTWTASTGGCE